MMTPAALAATVEQTAPHLGSRPAVAFAVSVEHAQALAREYLSHGITAAAVWGTMPARERAEVLSAWREGTVQLVANCGVLVEGFDYPELAAVVMARPTMNPGRYLQCLGRGTRNAPGKADCLVLDVSGRTGIASASPVTLPAVLAVDPDSVRLVASEDDERSDSEHGAYSDPIGRASRAWLRVGDRWAVALDKHTTSALLLAPVGTSGLWRVEQVSPDGVLSDPLPLRDAVAVAERELHRAGMASVLTARLAPWRRRDASARQVAYLAKLDSEAGQRADIGGWSSGKVGDAISALLVARLLARR